ncbi:MAG: DMT family transporter [Parasphingopyxis sp.]|nr:DMT family transporter [Sphingomonadales bacterium]
MPRLRFFPPASAFRTSRAAPNERPTQRPMLGILFRLIAVSSVALMATMVKLGGETGLETVEMIFWRFAFALPPTLLWVWLGPGLARLRPNRIRAHFWRAGVGLFAMYMVYWSVTLLPLAEALTIGFAAPLFATALSALLLKEAVGIYRWAAIAAGLAGVAIVMQPSTGNLPLIGVLVALGAAFGVGCATVTIRQVGRSESAEAIVVWFSVIAVCLLGALMPFIYSPHSAEQWLILALIGLFGGLGQIFITLSLRFAPVPVIAPFDYAQLLWAVGLGFIVFGDIPAAATWAGALLIVGSGLFTLYRERRRARLV